MKMDNVSDFLKDGITMKQVIVFDVESVLYLVAGAVAAAVVIMLIQKAIFGK